MVQWLKQLGNGIASRFIPPSERRYIGTMEIGETAYTRCSALDEDNGSWWLDLHADAVPTRRGDYSVEITRRPDGYHAYVTYSRRNQKSGGEWNPEGWTSYVGLSWEKP